MGGHTNNKWGYVVCFGTIITFVAGIGHVNSFGLIYNDFINETHSTAKSLTAAHGVFAVMLAIGGLILNLVSKKHSLRFGGFLGAATFTVGSITTIFISSTNQLPLTFGVLQGIGFGMMVPVCYATMNYYFDKKRRTTVMSVCKAVQGIILMGYPQLLRQFISMYGFRGTLLIISGISFHTVPGMAIMKTDEKLVKITAANGNDVEGNASELKNKENVKLLNLAEIEVTKDDTRSNANKIRSQIAEFFNLKVLRDPIFFNICLGQSFVNFSDITFFVFQPMLLFQYGYEKSEVATCISVCAGADVAGRCALALLSSLIPVNTRLLFYITTLLTLVTRLVVLQITSFAWVCVVTGALGVLRACLHVASPLVVANHVSHADFPGAYALFMLSTGVVNVLCAPLIGVLKDVYSDYVPAFYALAACCAPCLVFWPIEYLVRRHGSSPSSSSS
ncbi:monocarboxylate transporter 9-like [Leguminivora glycinivorella]|uniref:monocarboxylate transporter 9-like n=1 Tax=Leguminivora glycinivorella TaxID=1035111 RepID=UPI002010C573|nr:monocarboxylate transporter 9-like [Leguminivora glycinivorella]